MRRKPSPPPCHRLSPPPSLLLALLAHRCCTHVPAPTATATTAKPLLVRENESRGLTVPGYHARAPRSAPPAVRDELGVLPEVRGQLEEALLLTPQTEGMKALRWRRQRPCASTTGDREPEHGVSSTRLGRHWCALVGPPCWRRVRSHGSTTRSPKYSPT